VRAYFLGRKILPRDHQDASAKTRINLSGADFVQTASFFEYQSQYFMAGDHRAHSSLILVCSSLLYGGAWAARRGRPTDAGEESISDTWLSDLLTKIK
jgi:hypothetical protein